MHIIKMTGIAGAHVLAAEQHGCLFVDITAQVACGVPIWGRAADDCVTMEQEMAILMQKVFVLVGRHQRIGSGARDAGER